jgi:hypothetical protein
VLAKRAQEDAAAQDIDRLRRQSSFDDETGMYRAAPSINERSRCYALDLNQNRKHHLHDPRRIR